MAAIYPKALLISSNFKTLFQFRARRTQCPFEQSYI